MRYMRWAVAAGVVLVLAGLHLGWAWSIREAVDRSPAGGFAGQVTVRAGNTPATLGYDRLGQRRGPRSADDAHLGVTRDADGWVLANRSLQRKVDLRTERYDSLLLQRWRLEEGDRIAFDGAAVEVAAVSDERLVLRELATAREAVWADGRVTPTGEPAHDVCNSDWRRLRLEAKWAAREWFAADRAELPLFGIGGAVNCADRWKVAALPPGAVDVVWRAGGFWLAPGARRHDVVLSRAGGASVTFPQLSMAVDGEFGRVESLILGRTRYALEAGANALTLRPRSAEDFWREADAAPVPLEPAAWIGDGEPPLAWLRSLGPKRIAPAGVLALLAAAAVGFLWWRTKGRWTGFVPPLLVWPALLGGVWLFWLVRTGAGGPDTSLMAWAAWAAWLWGSVSMVLHGRLGGWSGVLWALGVALAGTGAVTLFQLGAGADNTWWLPFATKHGQILALAGMAFAGAAAMPLWLWERVWLWLFNRESVFALAAIGIAGLLVAQFALGGEEGIGGIQPVELTKTLAAVLLGFVGLHLTEARLREVRAFRRAPIRFLLPYLRVAGIFLLFALSVAAGVRDFSPLIILGIATAAFLWKLGVWRSSAMRMGWVWVGLRPALIVVGTALVGLLVWVHGNPDAVPEGFPQKDRIQVWAEPELHPHSGAQVLAGLDHVALGGWEGAQDWFGDNGTVMKVPAVQDDFITAFFLNRFGGYAGLALLAVQLLYVAALLGIARIAERNLGRGDFQDQDAGRVLSFALFILAWMHVAHWGISWGNSLGLLPVMGQPMSWLSAGNSHLIAYCLATLGLGLVTGWIATARE